MSDQLPGIVVGALLGSLLGAIFSYIVTRRLALENQARFSDRDVLRALFVELIENTNLAKTIPAQPIVRSAWDEARRAPLPPKERDAVIAAYVAGSALNAAIASNVSRSGDPRGERLLDQATAANAAFSEAVTTLDQTFKFSKEFPPAS
jgi:hypothetical protein